MRVGTRTRLARRSPTIYLSEVARVAIRHRLSALGTTLAVVSLIAACGAPDTMSNGTPADPDTPDEMVRLIDSHCTNLPAPDLGGGTLCVDNGFRISTDDFAFDNWGRSTSADANVTVQTLVDLFGRSAVCAPGPDDECILRPATVQRLEEWNNFLAGGRCEGFATLSARFFLGMEDPSTYRDGASRVAQLRRGDRGLDEALAYWWATQFLPEVTDRAATSRTRTPLRLVDDIIVGLAGGSGLTLGLYDDGSGHAVTPFAVTRRDGTYVVHIYDNNHPGERREVVVDASTDTWRYERALRGADGTWRDWSGGLGTMELTPMSARRGPFTCDFCATVPADEGTVVSIASRDPLSPGWLRLSTGEGTLDVTPEGISNTVAGATWTITKSAGAANVTVRIPSTRVDIAVRRTSTTSPAGDVVVSVRRNGHPDIQVQGDIAVAPDSSDPVVLVRDDNSTVRAPTGAPVRVSIADSEGLTRTTVGADGELVVGMIDAQTIEVSLKGAQGTARTELSASGSVTRTLALAGDTITVDTARIAPVPVQARRRPGFAPSPRLTPPSTTATTTTVDADDGPPPSIVVTLPD